MFSPELQRRARRRKRLQPAAGCSRLTRTATQTQTAARRRKPPQPAAECPRLTRAAAHGGGI